MCKYWLHVYIYTKLVSKLNFLTQSFVLPERNYALHKECVNELQYSLHTCVFLNTAFFRNAFSEFLTTCNKIGGTIRPVTRLYHIKINIYKP